MEREKDQVQSLYRAKRERREEIEWKMWSASERRGQSFLQTVLR